MFGFGKKDDDKKVSEAMRSMSDQIAKQAEEINKLQQQAQSGSASEKALAEARAQMTRMQADLAKMRADAANDEANEKALADAKAQMTKMQAELDALKNQGVQATKAAGDALGSAAGAVTGMIGGAASAAVGAVGALAAGVTAYVRKAGGMNLRLREGPGLDSSVLASLSPGTRMTLLEGPVQNDNYGWWRIRVDDGREGWVAGSELVTNPE